MGKKTWQVLIEQE
ncbi:hypothetical protein TIFTF001_056792, partial [Ficus carica]